MEDYINKLREIETLVESLIGKTITKEKALDIYSITNDLMNKGFPPYTDSTLYTDDKITEYAKNYAKNWDDDKTHESIAITSYRRGFKKALRIIKIID